MLKIAEKSVLIYAPPQIVWGGFYDVDCWKEWNPAMQRVDLLETPKAGAIGRIHTDRACTYPFKITRVTAGTGLEWQREYELGTILTQHYSVTRNAEGSVFTGGLSCEGGFAKMVVGIMRSRFSRDLDKQMAEMKAFCEKRWAEERNRVPHDSAWTASR